MLVVASYIARFLQGFQVRNHCFELHVILSMVIWDYRDPVVDLEGEGIGGVVDEDYVFHLSVVEDP